MFNGSLPLLVGTAWPSTNCALAIDPDLPAAADLEPYVTVLTPEPDTGARLSVETPDERFPVEWDKQSMLDAFSSVCRCGDDIGSIESPNP
jgi:hypothetical protein